LANSDTCHTRAAEGEGFSKKLHGRNFHIIFWMGLGDLMVNKF
jgi:hypothetical protein